APLGMVMGVCVYHVAHRTFGNILSNLGQNTELPQFTQALYDARELAMARMQAEAEALHAEGIVGVQLSQRNHSWGAHTTEFFSIGTAVRPIRPDHEIARPQLVLSLDRCGHVRPDAAARARRTGRGTYPGSPDGSRGTRSDHG